MNLPWKNMPFVLVVCAAAVAYGQTIIIDNQDPQCTILSDSWFTGAYGTPWGEDYFPSLTTGAGGSPAEIEWRPDLPASAVYEVSVYYVAGSNRADNSPYTVFFAGGSETIRVNQQLNTSTWVPLGSYAFEAGTSGSVSLSNDATPSYVIADAVRFRYLGNVQVIEPDNPNIRIGGSLFSGMDEFAMRLDRIDPQLFDTAGDLFSPAVAKLTSGVTIQLRTDSETIRANFNHLGYVVTENTGFVVYQNGVFDQLIHDMTTVDIISLHPGTAVTYTIVCPSYDEVTLAGVELETDASLYPLEPEKRPRYFAFGDSISHGAEIDADTKGDSTVSYPWQLAEAKGWELYNLAVGGSKVTPAFGSMLEGQRADIITILWGTNDKGRDNDLPLFSSKYDDLITNIRAAQPHTPMYCFTMITASYEGPGPNGYTVDDYRDAIANMVAARQAAGDCHIHLVRGELLTNVDDLSDGTHLNVEGAARFAGLLEGIIGNPWGDFNGDGAWNSADQELMSICLSGPGVALIPDLCEVCDHDCDGDVDLKDAATFQKRIKP